MCLELFWELMTLRATVGALLVGLVHSRVRGCGFLGEGCARNIGEMVQVCIDPESCWLATSHSDIWKMPGNSLGEATVLFFWGAPVNVGKGYVIPAKFVVEVVCHDLPLPYPRMIDGLRGSGNARGPVGHRWWILQSHCIVLSKRWTGVRGEGEKQA